MEKHELPSLLEQLSGLARLLGRSGAALVRVVDNAGRTHEAAQHIVVLTKMEPIALIIHGRRPTALIDREALGVVGTLAAEPPANELTDRVPALVAANASVRARV